jgi:uncharacterized protein YprB with RNaseH-like and TPR domain
VIQRTFIHVPGIGQRRERTLWERGYADWELFLRDHPPGAWKDLIASRLDERIVRRDLPARETWRMLASFPGRTAYLDLETEGLAVGHDAITCIGLSDGRDVEVFVRGENLSDFPRALRRFELLVTYNGSCFDMPVLRHAFPALDWDRLIHVDLRYPARRVGLTGGLKSIERALGLARSEEIAGAGGYLAVLLWKAHREGRAGARDTLVHYCLSDTVHLKPLAAHVFNHLTRDLPLAVAPMRDVAIPSIPYRPDASLVRELLAW